MCSRVQAIPQQAHERTEKVWLGMWCCHVYYTFCECPCKSCLHIIHTMWSLEMFCKTECVCNFKAGLRFIRHTRVENVLLSVELASPLLCSPVTPQMFSMMPKSGCQDNPWQRFKHFWKARRTGEQVLWTMPLVKYSWTSDPMTIKNGGGGLKTPLVWSLTHYLK